MAQHTGWPCRVAARGLSIGKLDHRFQTLVHTLGTSAADVQIFLKAHNERNLAEYEGRLEIDEKLVADLIRCTKTVEAAVAKLDPPSDTHAPSA